MLHVLALLFTAVSMGAGIAHVLEMHAKLPMSADQYLATQQLYRGWALTGIVLFAALGTAAALAVRVRAFELQFRLVTAATAAIVASLAIFFAFTYPVNRVTNNWTVLPSNWEALRTRWEYSHAAGAFCLFIALTLLSIAAVRSGD